MPVCVWCVWGGGGGGGGRDFSLFGRIQIIKAFSVSKIVLSTNTQRVPDYIGKRLEGIFFKFCWLSKYKVKRVRMIQNLESGGINMIDMKAFCSSFSASGIIRILEANPDDDNWGTVTKIVP